MDSRRGRLGRPRTASSAGAAYWDAGLGVDRAAATDAEAAGLGDSTVVGLAARRPVTEDVPGGHRLSRQLTTPDDRVGVNLA